jgi:hypothetical protein
LFPLSFFFAFFPPVVHTATIVFILDLRAQKALDILGALIDERRLSWDVRY